MTQQSQQEIVDFYLKLARETAQGIQKIVFQANEMSLEPKSAKDLCPVPVYEVSAKCSLLTQANIGRKSTVIDWPMTQGFEYLPAYYKRLRIDGKIVNKIVVNATNYCEARFFAAKELMHCFIDDDGLAASNSISLVNELIESLTVNWNGIEIMSKQRIVDEVAYLGALEYLIPSQWVPLLIKVKDNIAASDASANAFLHVAQLIRVPENVLRVRLRTQS
jgi:hypothetical protein